MSFASIATRTNGQTIDETWFNQLKSAGTTLEDYVTALKTGLSLNFYLDGYYSTYAASTNVMLYRVTQDIEIMTALMMVGVVGTGGNTEVDVYMKHGVAAFATMFTTKPKIPYTSGDNSTSATGAGATAGVLDSTKTLLVAGDLLRFDMTLAQTGSPKNVILNLGYRVTGAQ
jgi:hypothetical protein